MARSPILVTLLPSSDVDLGRWLLQHWQLDYVEHPHAPMFHLLALKWYGESGYPLFIDEGQHYPTIETMVADWDLRAESTRRLVPDADTEPALRDEVMALQHDFRWKMGNGTVHWAYYHLLPHRRLTWPSFTTGVPWWEVLAMTVGYGIVKRLMFRALTLGPRDAESALDTVRAGFDRCDALLADGRTFLAGDRLTLADLAFATSAAPMVLEERYGGHLPRLEDVPATMQTVVSELRARPAGAFVRRMYEQHRAPAPSR